MKEVTVSATAENLAVVTDFIDGELEASGCPMKQQMQVDVAVDEVFSNVAQYAYPDGGGNVTVRFEVGADPRCALITFMDRGIPYNPLEKEDPDVSLPLEMRAVGGLGIFMVKKMMDGMEYAYRDGQNILLIRKNF